MGVKRRLYVSYDENGEMLDAYEEFNELPDAFCKKCVSCNEREIAVNGVLTSLKTEIESMVFFILRDVIIKNEEQGKYDKIDLKKYGFDISK